jgi:hypothetical protein
VITSLSKIDLVVSPLASLDNIYSKRRKVTFFDRLRELHVVFRITDGVFIAPGAYQFTINVDEKWVAHRRLVIVSQEE